MDNRLRNRFRRYDYTNSTPSSFARDQSLTVKESNHNNTSTYDTEQSHNSQGHDITKPKQVNSKSRNFLKRKNNKRLFIYIAPIVLILLIIGSYAILKDKQTNTNFFGHFSGENRISVPLYYPADLPQGYSYNNDAKVISNNVFYFSVTGPGKQVFYITEEPIPLNFDFQSFSQKFLNPDNFISNSGTVVAGPIGNNMIGSVRTTKNTWILLNSAGSSSLNELETVIRSLELEPNS